MAPYTGMPWAGLPGPRPCLRVAATMHPVSNETPPTTPTVTSPFADHEDGPTDKPQTTLRLHVVAHGLHVTVQGHVVQHALVFAAHVLDAAGHRRSSPRTLHASSRNNPPFAEYMRLSLQIQACCVYMPRQPLTEDVLACSLPDALAVWPAAPVLRQRVQRGLHAQADGPLPAVGPLFRSSGSLGMPTLDAAALHVMLRDGSASRDGIDALVDSIHWVGSSEAAGSTGVETMMVDDDYGDHDDDENNHGSE